MVTRRGNKNPSFAERVYRALLRVPRGKVTTYKALARVIGKPRAYRAVGNALNKNPHPATSLVRLNSPQVRAGALVVPCHRVVATGGALGGYAGGLKKKIALLKREGVNIMNDRVDLKRYGFFS